MESNFQDSSLSSLAEQIAGAVFRANHRENESLNSVEIFVNRHTDTVINSRGIHKTQVRYDSMVEAIPTYNGEKQSVELYEQYNFNTLDEDAICREISDKLAEVRARYQAVKPSFAMDCKVILGKLELEQLFSSIAQDLNYASVYSLSNVYHKGDSIQTEPTGDRICLQMYGELPGNVKSVKFDDDGLSLGSIPLVQDGKVLNYYGSNRFGQYLGLQPTGLLPCMQVAGGSAGPEAFQEGPYLEVISMSGLQVNFYTDYIGGEVRLAYYHDGRNITPVTGISITGSIRQVLNTLVLSSQLAVHDSYMGPEKAILQGMKIF